MARHETALRLFRVIHYLETSRQGLRVSEIRQRLRDDEIHVDVRTVHRDVELLQQAHFPLVSEGSGSESRWILKPAAQTRAQVAFTFEEIFTLFVTRKSMDHLKGTPLAPSFDRVFTKLEKLLGYQAEAFVEIAEHLAFRPPVTWQTNAPPELLEAINGALVEGHALRLHYRSETGERAGVVAERLVGPECLYFASGSVYLIAVDIAKNEARTYALSRMVSAEMLGDVAYEKRGLTPDQNSLGMLGTGQLAEVELRVRGPVGAFVAERRWHTSQVTSRDGDEVVVRLRVKVNEELARFVLGLGPDARVVAPLALRDMVREMAERIAA